MSDRVTVTALRTHTHDGKEYQEGDTYEVEAEALENLRVLRMAVPSDQVPPKAETPPAE